MMTRGYSMQAVQGPGMGFHKLATLREQLTHLTNVKGWYPDLRDQVGCQQPGKNERVPNVCLDPCLCDLFHLDGIGHYHSSLSIHTCHNAIMFMNVQYYIPPPSSCISIFIHA